MHKINYQIWPCQFDLRLDFYPKAAISCHGLGLWGDLRRQNSPSWAWLHASWPLSQSQRHNKGDIREGHREERGSETERHPIRKESSSRYHMTREDWVSQKSEGEKGPERMCASEKQQEKHHRRQRRSWEGQHSTVESYKHWLLRRQKDNWISRGKPLAKRYISVLNWVLNVQLWLCLNKAPNLQL